MPGKGRAWLDYANDVTIKDVKLAAQENFASVEHMKRYTTQGMAPDQGKNSNVAALAVLADATGRGIPETGTTTFRPPFCAGVHRGDGGRGARCGVCTATLYDLAFRSRWNAGAPMIEAGLWYRPSYFPRPGEATWREACDREVKMVRSTVGVCDVSTLGKIDIQGKDAARFLDFVYTNMFSTLPVGKVRYGLMLREDGLVMDDGTTARLGDNHYLMTTTTAAAGAVMRHLDFVRAGVLRGLGRALHFGHRKLGAVCDCWSQGTRLAGDIGPAGFALHGRADGECRALTARLFRITFSGEQGYELAVPARYGEAMFRDLLARAETMGGGAYGMEVAERAADRKGLHHPCRNSWPGHGL